MDFWPFVFFLFVLLFALLSKYFTSPSNYLKVVHKREISSKDSNKTPWKRLAKAAGLTFKEGIGLVNNDTVSGRYRGYHLELTTFLMHTDTQITLSVIHTQPVILSHEFALGEPLTVAQIMHLLLPGGLPDWLKGKFEAKPAGLTFIYGNCSA